MKLRAVFALPFLLCLCHAQYPGAKRVPNQWKTGFDSIKEENAKDILGYLAGPDLRGRGSLSPDYWAAAGYVANELRKLGLKPAGDNGTYFHRFDLVRATTIPEATSIESLDGSLKIPYGAEFQTGWYGDLEAKVTFAFIHIPEKADLATFPWDRLKGRFVLFTAASRRNAAFAAKIATAREDYGVEQMISVPTDPLSTRTPTRTTGVKDTPDPRNSRVGAIRFSLTGARKIAEKTGGASFAHNNPDQLLIETPNTEFLVKTKSTQEVFPLVNVLAKLEGSDPAMAKESVVFGSHLDHIGPSNDGIRYGADDNASGCTANLLIAKAMMLNPTKPKRTVLFGFWAAEEAGVWGSYAYVSRPTLPTESMVAYINMDMLGRNEEVGVEIAENNWNVVYPGSVLTTSRDFYDRLIESNAFVGLRFKPDKTDRTNRSDTRSFVWKKVPTVKIFTGEHPDYHRAGDTIDKINWPKLINITKWLYISASELASRPDRPKFDPQPFVAPDHYVFAGRAIFREKIALGPKARLIVELEDSTGKQLQRVESAPTGGRSPFEMLTPKSLLVEGGKYQLRIMIQDGEKVIFATPEPIAVAPTGWTRAQEIELKMQP